MAGPPLSVVMMIPSPRSRIGGAETHARRLSSALNDRGHRVQLFMLADSFSPSLRVRRHLFAVGMALGLVRRAGQYRIAHFLLPGLHVVAGVPIAKLLGKKTVHMFGGSGEVLRLKETWRGRLQLTVLRRLADRIIILNGDMKQEALRLGFAREQVAWLPCEVDADEFHPVEGETRLERRRELGLPSDAVVLAFTGRFVAAKRIDRLIAAFAEVRERCPRIYLALAGDGPLREELQALVAAKGLTDMVRFTGPLSPTGVRNLLQASDVYALLSETEGIPCSLVEAMSVGLASLVSDIPAMGQLIESGVQGLCVGTENSDGIARALQWLIDHPAERGQMGRRARERILQHYTRERVAELHEELYRNL